MSRRKLFLIVFPLGLILIGVMAFMYMKQYSKHYREESKTRILEHIRRIVEDAQKNDTLYLYEPPLVYDGTEDEQFHAFFELMRGKEGIREFAIEGSSKYCFDEKIIECLATMPDLHSITFDRTSLRGELFRPLGKSDRNFAVDLGLGPVENASWVSLFEQKNITKITLLFHPRDTENEKNNLVATITPLLLNSQHLEYLLLDAAFLPHKEAIEQALPNTEIQFGHVDDRSGEVIVEGNENLL